MDKVDLLKTLHERSIIANDMFNASMGRWHGKDLREPLEGHYPRLSGHKMAELVYWLHHDLNDYPKTCALEGCENRVTDFHSFPIGYFHDYCCNRCAQLDKKTRDKIKATNIERRGVEHQMLDQTTKDKLAATNMERYGVANPFEAEAVKEKIKATTREKYGVENVSKSVEIHAKKRETTMRNYGVEHPFHLRDKIAATMLARYGGRGALDSPEIATKIRQTLKERYNVANPMSHPSFRNRSLATRRQDRLDAMTDEVRAEYLDDDFARTALQKMTVVELAQRWGMDHTTLYRDFANRGITWDHGQFSLENTVKNFLTEQNIPYLVRDRQILRPQELDIVLPEHKIAIEVNGNYWHAEIAGGKNHHYHLAKTKACAEKGWRLLHFFEDEILFKPHIVCSKIASLVGKHKKLGARHCSIGEPSAQQSNLFLEDNHLQGPVQASHRRALYHDGEMVGLMTFGKSRFSKQHEWEMLRFVTKCGLTIQGGASRLLKSFLKDVQPRSIVTYADLRYSRKGFYEQLGFTFLRTSRPDYFYIKNRIRESRLKYQKHKLADILAVFDPSMTEWENMKANRRDRIWDCGNLVYEYRS